MLVEIVHKICTKICKLNEKEIKFRKFITKIYKFRFLKKLSIFGKLSISEIISRELFIWYFDKRGRSIELDTKFYSFIFE